MEDGSLRKLFTDIIVFWMILRGRENTVYILIISDFITKNFRIAHEHLCKIKWTHHPGFWKGQPCKNVLSNHKRLFNYSRTCFLEYNRVLIIYEYNPLDVYQHDMMFEVICCNIQAQNRYIVYIFVAVSSQSRRENFAPESIMDLQRFSEFEKKLHWWYKSISNTISCYIFEWSSNIHISWGIVVHGTFLMKILKREGLLLHKNEMQSLTLLK